MDRLAAMEAFVRVIEAGSFSGAAKQLHLGQPAVSKAIAQLEDRLGVRLLLRSTHGSAPTDAGRSFYERAKRAIEEAEEAELTARGAAATLSGRLRVCAAATFARLHVIPRLPTFLAAHPALDVDIVMQDGDIDLVETGIDVALRISPLRDTALVAENRRWSPARHRNTRLFCRARRTAKPIRSRKASGRRLRAATRRPDVDLAESEHGELGYFGRPSSCHGGRGTLGSGVRRIGLYHRFGMDVRAGAEIRRRRIRA